MEPARQVIREFRWREIFPGLMLARVFRCSLRLSSISLGLFAVILISLGWQTCTYLILPKGTYLRGETSWNYVPNAESADRGQFAGRNYFEPVFYTPQQDWKGFFTAPLAREFDRFIAPVRILFTQHQDYRLRACWICGLLWTVLVGAFFGGIICRMAAFDLATQERYGMLRSIRYVARKYRSFIAAPLMLLLLFAVLIIPVVLLGFIAQYVFTPLAALLWGFGFAWSLLVAVVAATSMFAWPLIWPALATEDSDSFDAIGASIGYASQRPLTYLGYALAAIFVSGCGLFLFALLLEVAGAIMRVSLGVFAQESLLSPFFFRTVGEPRNTSESVVDFWNYLFSFLYQAYVFSVFWISSTGIYLLLRHHVDGSELDDVYRDGGEDDKPMPKLAREMGLTGEAASMTSPVAPAAAKAD